MCTRAHACVRSGQHQDGRVILDLFVYPHTHKHTQHDPIGDLLSSKFPDIPRKPLLSVEHVSMDAEGLRRLVVSCD